VEEPEALAELTARRAELMRRIRDANRGAKRGRVATIAVSTIIAVVAPAFALFFSDQLASGPFWLLVWLSVLAAGLALATWWMEPENLATNEV
jgi:anti-sigma-K factor RskA